MPLSFIFLGKVYLVFIRVLQNILVFLIVCVCYMWVLKCVVYDKYNFGFDLLSSLWSSELHGNHFTAHTCHNLEALFLLHPSVGTLDIPTSLILSPSLSPLSFLSFLFLMCLLLFFNMEPFKDTFEFSFEFVFL